MHDKAILLIENKIKGSLVNCNIEDNFPEFESLYIHISSLSNEVLKHKKQWLNYSDIFSIFYDFVIESISDKIIKVAKNKDEEVKEINGNLWDILGEKDGEKLVNRIKEFIVSIPRDFDIYIPLPKNTLNITENIQLSEGLAIVVFNEAEKVPVAHQENALLSGLGNNFELGKVYLRQRLSGYCGNNIEDFSNKKAISNFKILMQQGIFRQLFKVNYDEILGVGLLRMSSIHQVPKVHLLIIDINRTPEKVLKVELPLDFSKFISNIDFNLFRPKESLAKNGFELEKVIISYLKKPVALIECNDDDSFRVKSAIQWCFNSYVLENNTIAFLQICIGLEAIFGDNGYNGSLTEILADRCSYLVSSDIKGRKSIKEEFKKLYKVRSQLVHGNITELDSNQKQHLDWGRTILEYAISKEIKHLNLGEPQVSS